MMSRSRPQIAVLPASTNLRTAKGGGFGHNMCCLLFPVLLGQAFSNEDSIISESENCYSRPVGDAVTTERDYGTFDCGRTWPRCRGPLTEFGRDDSHGRVIAAVGAQTADTPSSKRILNLIFDCRRTRVLPWPTARAPFKGCVRS
jgi:hypothetical protein